MSVLFDPTVAIVFIFTFVICFAVIFMAVSYMALQKRRQDSMKQIPRAGEIWTQDGDTLHIVLTTPNQIHLRVFTKSGIDEWAESWEEWFKRCMHRTVLRTGFWWNGGL